MTFKFLQKLIFNFDIKIKKEKNDKDKEMDLEEDEEMFYDQIPNKEKLNLSSTSGDQDTDMVKKLTIIKLKKKIK